MSSSQPSPPSTSPRPPATRLVGLGSPLRPQSTPIPSGVTSNLRTRAVSQQSTLPSHDDSVRKISSGPASVSTASLPNSNQPDRNRSKARDLLRKHYGLGVGPPLPSGKPQDPMDLGKPAVRCTLINGISSWLFPLSDSPAFDAKAYYEQLITTSSLATLLKRESELLSGMPLSSLVLLLYINDASVLHRN